MKTAIIMMLMAISFSTYSQKRFVRAENSIHKVTISKDGSSLSFDGRIYLIDPKKGWYRKDSIVWVYGHNEIKFKDVVKVGFYNNYKNYVVSIKTEKLAR